MAALDHHGVDICRTIAVERERIEYYFLPADFDRSTTANNLILRGVESDMRLRCVSRSERHLIGLGIDDEPRRHAVDVCNRVMVPVLAAFDHGIDGWRYWGRGGTRIRCSFECWRWRGSWSWRHRRGQPNRDTHDCDKGKRDLHRVDISASNEVAANGDGR